jgi:hypothetical protein
MLRFKDCQLELEFIDGIHGYVANDQLQALSVQRNQFLSHPSLAFVVVDVIFGLIVHVSFIPNLQGSDM